MSSPHAGHTQYLSAKVKNNRHPQNSPLAIIMIIGHLPAGYIFSKFFTSKITNIWANKRYVLAAGLVGAIAPDLDMIYFHLIDNRQHHHHTYWSHYPSVWLLLFATILLWHNISRRKTLSTIALCFSATGLLHLVLDSIVGDIWWLAPFNDQPYVMFTVPALYKPWWINFILHWSFALEILFTVWAVLLWRKQSSLQRYQINISF